MGKTAANVLIQYESSQAQVAEELTDSGDHVIFTGSADVWSKRSGYEPTVMPNGIVSGWNFLTPHADDDKISYAAFTAYIGGALVSVSAGTVSITRASTDTHVKNSIVCDSSGVVTAVKGTEGTAFSTTRAAAGGPPLIDVAKIEIGQVKTSAQASAAIDSEEILQNPSNTEQERYNYPVFDYNALGDGNAATDADKENAHVEFSSALPLIHTGGVAKKVFIDCYEPDFTELQETIDWKPAEETPSVTSKQIYRKTTASVSNSLSAASFKVYWEDPIGHPLKKLAGNNLIFKVFPDYNSSPYSLTQGVVGFSSTYPVADDMGADVTVGATQASVGFDS